MEPPPRFDLDQAIAAWRAELARHPGPAPADLRELEAHLRDGFAELKKKDLSEEEAFLVARHRIGPPKPVAGEFAKRMPPRLWRSRVFWWTFLGVISAFAGYVLTRAPLYQATATLRLNKVVVSAMQSSPTTGLTEELNSYINLVETRKVAEQVAARMTDNEKRDFMAPFKSANPPNLVDRLMMQRTVWLGRFAYLIQVSVEHPDAALAAKIADDFAQVSIEVNDHDLKERADQAVAILQNDYNEKKLQIENFQLQMSALVEKYGKSDLDPQRTTMPAELAALNNTRVMDQGTLDIAEEHWNQVKAYQDSVPPKDLSSLSFIAADGPISKLKSALDQDQAQLAGLQQKFGENHPQIKDLTQQLAQTKQELEAACATVAQRVYADYLAAKEKFDASNEHVQYLADEMQLLQAAQVNYNQIAMDKNSAELLAQNMATTIEDQREHVLMSGASFSIVDSANGQVIQTEPMPILTMVYLGFFSGLAAAVVATLLVRLLSSSRPPPPPAESVL